MSIEDRCPVPASSSAPAKEVCSTRTTIGSTPGTDGCGQAVMDLSADPVAEVLDVGVAAQERLGGRVDQGRALGGQQHHGPHGVEDPIVHRSRRSRLHGRQRLHAPPEHLGQQMVLRAEVVVGGGRGHPGPAGHVAHGQPGVADLFDLVHGGLHQLGHHLGLAGREAPSGGLDPVGASGRTTMPSLIRLADRRGVVLRGHRRRRWARGTARRWCAHGIGL